MGIEDQPAAQLVPAHSETKSSLADLPLLTRGVSFDYYRVADKPGVRVAVRATFHQYPVKGEASWPRRIRPKPPFIDLSLTSGWRVRKMKRPERRASHSDRPDHLDRKSTRLNSSHANI